jgi:DNA-binding CsgD family transcriptional regulator
METGQPRYAQLIDVALHVQREDWDATKGRVSTLLSLPFFRRLTMLELAPLVYAQGDTATAEHYLEELFPAGPDTAPGTMHLHGGLRMQRVAAALAVDAGNYPQARRWIAAHDHWLAWSGAVLGRAEGQALWAHFHRQAGDARAAQAHAESALADATDPRQPLALLAAHRLLGELATDAGRFEDAATHLAASLTLADACAAPFERALTLMALAELHAATDKRADAHAYLDQVRAICTPLGARPTLARAEILSVHLATLHAAPHAHPAGLSAREVEVLRLVARGDSNRAIAAALSVSVWTVKQHVAHILDKTGAENRAAATAFAVRHDLA